MFYLLCFGATLTKGLDKDKIKLRTTGVRHYLNRGRDGLENDINLVVKGLDDSINKFI